VRLGNLTRLGAGLYTLVVRTGRGARTRVRLRQAIEIVVPR
jgi:hypothetical protein